QPYAEAARRLPAVISSAPELVAEERLRLARLEDALAAGFARDLGEPADGMRPRALAAIALAGLTDAWSAWLETHAGDAELQLAEALEAKAEHVVRVLECGREYVDRLPS